MAAQEVVAQERQVLGAGAQRRHLDVEDVEAVVEVLAELAALHHVLQVAVGGGDDAHVDLLGLGAADRHEGPLLQHAQELDLHGGRHVADLVEEERAAVGDA